MPFNSIHYGLKQAVYNECRSFSQRSRLLGPLKRNTSNGMLFFPNPSAAVQDIHLLLRYSPRSDKEGGLYLQLATSYLLSQNLQRLSAQQRMRTRVSVFLGEKYPIDIYERLSAWFKSIYAPYSAVTNIMRTVAGNQASWEFMMNYTTHNEAQLDAILFQLEDDYICEADMVSDTIEFFASHNPCFVHQTDYPDRYALAVNDDDGRITIVAGRTRMWRSITSTTVSYACRLRTFLAFEDIIMQPKNDWLASHDVRARGGDAVFFCAIPSHGAHTETLLWPKRRKSFDDIAVAAYHKDWWLLARRALSEAQNKATFPAEAVHESDLFAS
jgi:hypothetical protein